MDFGKAIRNRREKLGLTQEQLAEKAGCHISYISQLERGNKSSPSPKILTSIATALGIPAWRLWKEAS